MLFEKEKQLKGVESFDPSKCVIKDPSSTTFEKDEVPMGCSEGCFAGPIWTRTK